MTIMHSTTGGIPAVYWSSGSQRAVMAYYDSALARWPVPCETVYVPTCFGQTHVILCGDPHAPPLVLLHGHSAMGIMWATASAVLSPHYRLYIPDLIGEAGKSAPTIPADRDNDYPGWLGETLDGLAVDRVRVVGQSLGGWLALRFALQFPERVSQVAALAPAGVVPTQPLNVVSAALPGILHRDVWQAAVEHVVHGPVDPIAEGGLAATLQHCTGLVVTFRLFSDHELNSVTMPVMVMVGEQDTFFSAHAMLERAALIPGAVGVFVSGATHLLPYSRAEIVMPLLLDFLRDPGTVREPPTKPAGAG